MISFFRRFFAILLSVFTCISAFFCGTSVLTWRQDSAFDRLTAEAEIGTVMEDAVIPTVKCAENEAVFTIRGGGNNSVVKVNGFTKFGKLNVEEKTDGVWTPVSLASVWGYDGYGVQYDQDGTYCYSFVYNSDGSARTFRVTVD
ncbi:MAG: hypothetical protein K6C36_06730 [Clostridia bacterium]|nr:hypothetical protein [Clostridia bacterium]